MMPEPTTVATSNAVPSASATKRRGKSNFCISALSSGRRPTLDTTDIAQLCPERQPPDSPDLPVLQEICLDFSTHGLNNSFD